jgi:hypothetical protein
MSDPATETLSDQGPKTSAVTFTTTSANSIAEQVAKRTSLTAALDRMGLNLPPSDLYDEDEHSILHGYNEEAMDLMVSRLDEQFPGDPDAALIFSVVTVRADRSCGAVWLDSDQRAVVALMLNHLANRIPAVPEARRSLVARIVQAIRRNS